MRCQCHPHRTIGRGAAVVLARARPLAESVIEEMDGVGENVDANDSIEDDNDSIEDDDSMKDVD